MSIRIYLPISRERLAGLVADAGLDGPLAAHAVTEGLRTEWSEADEEELEYAALAAAAQESWDSRCPEDRPRRLVVAADVSVVQPRVLPGEPTAVEVIDGLDWKQVAAAHVDTEDQRPVDGEALGELAWFATQEIPDLL